MDQSETPRHLLLQIVKEKHKKLQILMKQYDIDCYLIFVRETAANPDPVQKMLVAGDVVWESAFIFSLNKNDNFSKIAIVGNFDADAEKEKGIWDKVIAYKEGISQYLKEIITNINPTKLALNFSLDEVMADGLSHGMYLKLASILADRVNTFTSAEKLVQEIRSKKTKTEIELITEACIVTEQINTKISKMIHPDMVEANIQELFYNEMDKLGVKEAWQRNSCPAIDAGPDKNMGHIGPTNLKTKHGHTLHNDFGIQLNGYCSDLQRMWYFGNESDIPEELKHAFETVKGAIRKAAEYIKPGTTGTSVDAIAREYIKAQGYKEFEHALGHQVCTKAHDGGVHQGPIWERYAETPKGLITEDNIFTLELYVRTKNYGQVSLEEMIIITEKGAKFLVPPQEKFICIN